MIAALLNQPQSSAPEPQVQSDDATMKLSIKHRSSMFGGEQMFVELGEAINLYL